MTIQDRYVLDERLGTGGMAEVFRARRVGVNDFNRSVAVKRMLGGYSSSAKFQEMFATEARITSRLLHPNIVSVLDFDRDQGGALCLVMEHVDGCDLSKLARTGLLPFEVVTFVIVEALKGLGFAHRFSRDGIKGVIHRDVSPHNLLISWHGEVKVSDFGLAKIRSGDAATATGGLKGKPAYMSPEQANGQPLDGRSDLFAVGTIMWELLVGRPLFGADDSRASLAAVLFGTVPPPRHLRPDVPRDLEKVAIKLLARNRGDRYKTAEAAIADLLRCRTYIADGRLSLATAMARRFGRMAPPARRLNQQQPASRSGTRGIGRILLVATCVAASIATAWCSRPRGAVPARSAPVGPIDERAALVEPVPSTSYEPTFKFALDAKELPPSCLLLLDWWSRTARLKTMPATIRADAGRRLEAYHDELAEMVTIGNTLRYIDETCRTDTWMYHSKGHEPYAAPPLPFLDDHINIHYEDPNPRHPDFWNAYVRATN